jgi:ataxin-10
MDDQDPAFEWLCLVFKTLFEAGYSKHLYNAVGAHLLSKLWSRVTPEQLILLRMFTMWMTSHRDKAASRTPGESFRDGKAHRSLPLQDEEAFEVVFEFVAKTWVSIVSQETEDRPEEADTMRKQLWIELENEAKLLLLDVMGELTLARVTPSPSRRELGELLLQSLLSELQFVWSLRRLGPPAPPRAGDTTPQSARPSTEPLGYRSAIIRVVGNLSYRHTDHQDLVRDGGFLPLFLNHCNIDESNPLLREWSLVALRNLCEGNAANQAYINELRPQGIDRSSVNLDAMNVDATLGEDGKLKVTRKPTTKE